MFNLEMVCNDGIFQLCDDIFSEKLTKKQAKDCACQFYMDLKEAKSCIFNEKEISFNVCTFWCNDEEKENILFNISIIKDAIFEMAQTIFDVFHNIENTNCPNHWMTFNTTVISLIDYKNSLFK